MRMNWWRFSREICERRCSIVEHTYARQTSGMLLQSRQTRYFVFFRTQYFRMRKITGPIFLELGLTIRQHLRRVKCCVDSVFRTYLGNH